MRSELELSQIKLSLAVTHYNRFDMIIKSFDSVVDDTRITEIIISDDKSTDGSYEALLEYFKDYPKVRIYQNEENLNMSRNKAAAIDRCRNEWVIIFDSDNIISRRYLDALYSVPDAFRNHKEIWMPEWAMSEFDFRKFTGLRVDRENVKEVVTDSLGNVMFNCCNYVVNRSFYLDTYKYDPAHLASDTVNHNKNHLLAGGSFYVVPGMRYTHTTGEHSGFMQNVHYNMMKAEEVRKEILAM